jgi:DNA mismatch repair protein MutL
MYTRNAVALFLFSFAESFARTYLEGLDDHSGKNDTVIDKLIMKSCKSAVKANEHLSRLEIDQLIRDLAACSNPYCCPHGRPTMIVMTQYEVDRKFKRIV